MLGGVGWDPGSGSDSDLAAAAKRLEEVGNPACPPWVRQRGGGPLHHIPLPDAAWLEGGSCRVMEKKCYAPPCGGAVLRRRLSIRTAAGMCWASWGRRGVQSERHATLCGPAGLFARSLRVTHERSYSTIVDDRYTQRSRPHVGSHPRRLALSERLPRACNALESCQRTLRQSNAARGLFSPCALAARSPMDSAFVASAPAGCRVARSFLGRHMRSTYPDPPTSPAPRKTPWLGRLEKRPSLFRRFTLHAVGTVGSTPHARAPAALRHRPCLRPDGSSAAPFLAGAVAYSHRLQRSDCSSFPATTSAGAGAPQWIGAVAGAGVLVFNGVAAVSRRLWHRTSWPATHRALGSRIRAI
jgi:hypothetical protein